MTAPRIKPLDPAIEPSGGGLGDAVGSAVAGSSVVGGGPTEGPGGGYRDLFYRLFMGALPPGAYRDEDDEPHAAIYYGAAEGCGRALALIYRLAEEVFPQLATECLPDWEELYGIPAAAGATLEDRRDALLALSRGGKSCSVASFVEQLTPLLGAGCFTLAENRAAWVTPEPDMIYFTFVWRDPAQPGSYDIEAAQRVADRAKEAHLLILVGESSCFLTNDTYSRTNRDILGA